MGYSRLSTAYTASLSPKRMNKTCKCSSLFLLVIVIPLVNFFPKQNINFYEIKPIEVINKRNPHLRNSGLFKPELFNEAYKPALWQFK